jgi:hypothetical protein
LAFETGFSLPQNIYLNAVCLEGSEKELLPILTLLTNSGVLVSQQTIPTERPPLVGEVSANFTYFTALNFL